MATYYHVIVEKHSTSKGTKTQALKDRIVFEKDRSSVDSFMNDIIIPYFNRKEIYIDGQHINFESILSLKVKSSELKLYDIKNIIENNVPPNIVWFVSEWEVLRNNDEYLKDITREVRDQHNQLKPVVQPMTQKPQPKVDDKQVFIVHGRDEASKVSVARFIGKIGLKEVILHEKPSGGKTIIEKIEEHTDVGYAIIIYTPCDFGMLADNSNTDLKPRARQNVVWEHGYLVAKLGRNKVTALIKGNVEVPSDISGIVYVPFDEPGQWRYTIAKEMRSAGYKVDLNDI